MQRLPSRSIQIIIRNIMSFILLQLFIWNLQQQRRLILWKHKCARLQPLSWVSPINGEGKIQQMALIVLASVNMSISKKGLPFPERLMSNFMPWHLFINCKRAIWFFSEPMVAWCLMWGFIWEMAILFILRKPDRIFAKTIWKIRIGEHGMQGLGVHCRQRSPHVLREPTLI